MLFKSRKVREGYYWRLTGANTQSLMVNVGGEGGMAAVIGPVGVHDPNFGDGGVALLVIAEIALQILQVVQIHSQSQLVAQCAQRAVIRRTPRPTKIVPARRSSHKPARPWRCSQLTTAPEK